MADELSPEAQAAADAAEGYDKARDAMRDYNKQLRILMKDEEANAELIEGLKKKHANLSKKLRDTSKAQSEFSEALQLAQEQGRATAKGLGALIGLNESYETSMLGSVSAILKGGEAQKKFRDQMGKTFSAQNIGYSMLQKITQATIKLAYEQDTALVSFNKQTGAARLYKNELLDLESSMFRHGITSADAAEALGGLVRTVHGLRTMSQASRTELVETTGILQELGISADTTGANVHFMTRALGMSVAESTKYQRELLVLAQQIGMPPAEMAEGFKSAQPKLAAFGKDAGRVFKKLATAARASGIEIQQMLAIVEQFDTFEGAATSVGKLNAILGGPFLNSMEMVMQTDPTERMRMLSGALNKAGKSFDQLTYYEKKSIAAAAGLSDVNELALVMAGNFEGVAGGAQKSQAEIEQLAAQTKEMNDIGEELNQVIRMFAVEMRPVIGWLKSGLELFQDLAPTIKNLLPLITGFGVATLTAGTAVNLYTGLMVFGFQGLTGAAVAAWTAVAWPVLGAAAVLAAGWLIYEMTGSLEVIFLAAAVAAGLFAFAMGWITGPILLATAVISALVAGVMWLMDAFFFTNVGHSNFLEGTMQLADAYGNVGDKARLAAEGIGKVNSAAASSTAFADATTAAKKTPPTYVSDSPEVTKKSEGTSGKAARIAARKTQTIILQLDERYFKDKVVKITGKELDVNTGGLK